MTTIDVTARQFDHLNQYYCPKVQEPQGCVRYFCLKKKPAPPGWVGPESVECYDPQSGATAVPLVWNPVYNKGTNPPFDRQAHQCTNTNQSSCTWVWILVTILLIGSIIWLIWWLTHNKPEKRTPRFPAVPYYA